MNIKWDAGTYARDFSFVHKYGEDVIGLLDIREGMTVIDLGCGNGALTKKLSELGVAAIGIDASEEQLAAARKSYPGLTFINADATSFSVSERVDAVFSNAVFHWIDRENQPKMLACVNRALKDGGQLVFELGGYGNNVLIHSALDESFAKEGLHYKMPFYFPTIGEYSALLESCGFLTESMTLFDRPTPLNGENGLSEWIRMFVKKPFEGMDEGEKSIIVSRAEEMLKDTLCKDGVWYADYVRIRGKAIKEPLINSRLEAKNLYSIFCL